MVFKCHFLKHPSHHSKPMAKARMSRGMASKLWCVVKMDIPSGCHSGHPELCLFCVKQRRAYEHRRGRRMSMRNQSTLWAGFRWLVRGEKNSRIKTRFQA